MSWKPSKVSFFKKERKERGRERERTRNSFKCHRVLLEITIEISNVEVIHDLDKKLVSSIIREDLFGIGS